VETKGAGGRRAPKKDSCRAKKGQLAPIKKIEKELVSRDEGISRKPLSFPGTRQVTKTEREGGKPKPTSVNPPTGGV